MYNCNDENYYEVLDEHDRVQKKLKIEFHFVKLDEASQLIRYLPLEFLDSQIIDPRLFLPLELFSDRVDDD